MSNHGSCEIDHLAIGLTRPAMVLGVAKNIVFANVLITVVVCLNSHSFCPIIFGGLLHGVAMLQSQHEPLFLSIYWKSLSLTPPVPNFRFWGRTNSYRPD